MNAPDADPVTFCCEAIMHNPAVSGWLKRALASALDRDVVDTMTDAEVLLAVLRQRCDAALLTSEPVADLVETLPRYLEHLGYRLRFWNHEMLREPEAVLAVIRMAIAVRDPPHPNPQCC